MAAIAIGLGEDPLLFTLPPTAPPNAVAFAYHELRVADRAGRGMVIDPFALIVTGLLMVWLGGPALDIRPDVASPWAR
jgi:hypothetical protein